MKTDKARTDQSSALDPPILRHPLALCRSSTVCARGPIRAESTSHPLAPPIELSTVYCLADLDHVDALNDGSAKGFIYARDGHPNASQLAEKMAAAGGG